MAFKNTLTLNCLFFWKENYGAIPILPFQDMLYNFLYKDVHDKISRATLQTIYSKPLYVCVWKAKKGKYWRKFFNIPKSCLLNLPSQNVSSKENKNIEGQSLAKKGHFTWSVDSINRFRFQKTLASFSNKFNIKNKKRNYIFYVLAVWRSISSWKSENFCLVIKRSTENPIWIVRVWVSEEEERRLDLYLRGEKRERKREKKLW